MNTTIAGLDAMALWTLLIMVTVAGVICRGLGLSHWAAVLLDVDLKLESEMVGRVT